MTIGEIIALLASLCFIFILIIGWIEYSMREVFEQTLWEVQEDWRRDNEKIELVAGFGVELTYDGDSVIIYTINK